MNKNGILAIACVALLATCSRVVQSPPPADAPALSPQAEPAVVVQPPPPIMREFRGAWVSPVWKSDWPSRAGLTPDSQRAELRTLLDRAQETGLNAVLLHVRMADDALYPTSRAPWSSYLTGEVGRAPEPFYDPLQFAVTEAHNRGLQLHAWFNPFRAAPPDRKTTRLAHPDWVVAYGSQKWIDPGNPAARRAALDAMLEVVDFYDIDGIHLDDYFYPYLENDKSGRTITFPDDATWKRYGVPAGFTGRPDWRRANIDEFVATLYREVKSRKPWLSVGISPFGIWRPGYPNGITGLNAYSEIFADSRRWLREGWIDYLAPQLYWPLDGVQSRFTRLDEWWREQNVMKRHIWPGLHTERELPSRSSWAFGEIAKQIDTLRVVRANSTEALGHIHFRLGSVKRLQETLHSHTYRQPALTPAMPWLDARVPAEPVVTAAGGQLRIVSADSVPVRWFAVQQLDRAGAWQLSVHRADRETVIPFGGVEKPQSIAVRAVTPTGMQSAPAILMLP